MSGPRSRAVRAGLLALALAVGVAGCLPQQASLPRTTPMDPPPLPPRRPAPPPDFVAQHDRGPIPAGLYRVRPGDTVYSVAQRSGLPLRALIDVNRLQPPYDLTVGRDLIVPRARVHVVKAGDTMYGISRTFGVDMSELTRLNAIGPPYEIRVGQRLVLPDPGTRQLAAQPAATPVPPNAPVSEPQLVPLPAPRPAEAPAQADTEEPPAPVAEAPQRQADSAVDAPPLPPRRPQTASPAPVPQQAAPQQAAPQQAPPQTASIPQPPPRAGGRFAWPVRGNILARYGPQSGGRHNDGINIAAPRGAPILAAENGVVAYVGSELKGFGNLVLLKHADGWVTAYAHADSITVRLGETVRRGQPIGRVGASGAVDAPQLHFEIRKGTNAIDPLQMLDGQA